MSDVKDFTEGSDLNDELVRRSSPLLDPLYTEYVDALEGESASEGVVPESILPGVFSATGTNQGIQFGTESNVGFMQSKNYVASTTGWRLDSTGALYAFSGTFAGSITATTGSIGGFDIGADYIRDAADSFGLASTVTGGDDVRFWAGDTFANRATAPFRITEAGAIVATSATITGAITITSGSGIANLSDAGALAVLDTVDTAQIASAAVTTAKIAADAVTAAEIATGAVGSNEIAAGAIIAGKIAAGTIVAADIAAGTITGAKIAATTITAANIAALTITAGEIAANTITANKLSVSQLSAIAADLGTITAGTITGGTIQTSAAANTGIKLTSTALKGYDASNRETFSLAATDGILEAADGKYYSLYTAGENISAGDVVCIKGSSETQTATSTDHDASVEDTDGTAGGAPGSGATDMYVGTAGSGNQYFSYLRFNSLTQSATVVNCKLRLYLIARVGAIATGIEIRRVTSTWDESTIAGNSQPTNASTTHDRIASFADGSMTAGQTFDIDITNLYRMWKNSGYSNFGVQIRTLSGAAAGLYYRFATSENSGNEPKLIITSDETSDGKVYKASDTDYNLVKSVVGVAPAAITSGDVGKVQFAGKSTPNGSAGAGATAWVNVANVVGSITSLTYAAQLGICTNATGPEVFLSIVKPRFIEIYHDANDFGATGFKYAALSAGDTWECAAPAEASVAIVTVRAGSGFSNYGQNDILFQVPVQRQGLKYNAVDGFTAGSSYEHDRVLSVDWDSNANYIQIQYANQIIGGGGTDLRVQVAWYRS